MTVAEEHLVRAKTQLILGEPFFATLVLKMSFHEDSSIKTMCTDGSRIRYNPEYIMSLDLDELKGVLAHDVMHPALLHHTRRGGRDLKKWNKACDYAINPMLLDHGFKLPSLALIKDEFRDLPAEMIFNLLEDEPEGDNNGDNDPGGCGGVEDSQAESQAEISQEEIDMKETLQQAEAIAKKQGKLPSFLKRLIDEILEPKVNWKEVLARFLSEISRDDYTFKKPNPRYLHTGFYLPFLQNETIGEIILVVDTSGSINRELLNNFGSEMQEIVNTFGKGFTVVYVDAEVKSTEEIEPDGPVDLHPSGGGGTDFKPAFEWVDQQGIQPKALVYFTDMACNSFPETPDYSVLWVKYGKWENEEPPFGELINILE
jgi:predicted metal-dependent peptidase